MEMTPTKITLSSSNGVTQTFNDTYTQNGLRLALRFAGTDGAISDMRVIQS